MSKMRDCEHKTTTDTPRLVVFTLGNIEVPAGLRRFSLPEPRARETLSERSQQLVDALGRVADIVAWGNGRLPALRYTDDERLRYAARCQWFLQKLSAAGIRYDAVFQQGCHPFIFHRCPYFIWSDAGTSAAMDYAPLDQGGLPLCSPSVRPETMLYREATGILAFSPFAARNALLLTGCMPERVHEVGVGIADLAGSDLRKPDGPPQLLWVGTDLIAKGGADLVSAFQTVRERFPDARLTLVGCSTTIRVPGVESLPFLSGRRRKELLELYRRATLLVLPSYKESFGLVYLEAMAHKTPVLATSRGGMAELVGRHDLGRVVVPGDPKVLAETIIHMLSDRSTLRQQGENGYEYVRAHADWGLVAARIAGVIRESLHSPAKTPRVTQTATRHDFMA